LDIIARVNEKARFFSNQWIQWTTTLYEEVETLVVVNGQKGKSFQMEGDLSKMPHNTLSISLCGRCTRLYDF
jgi:hypothetical protein